MRKVARYAFGFGGLGTLVLLLAFGFAVKALGAEDKGPVWRSNRGTIVFQTTPFEAVDDTKVFAKIVKKARRNRTLRQDKDGKWKMHFMAFMRKAPGAERVNLVWYRLGRKREQVDYTELTVPPDGITLTAHTTLDPNVFKRGDKLEGRITRIIGRKEVVYAKCNLTLR